MQRISMVKTFKSMDAERSFDMNTLSVYCIKYAESDLLEDMVFDGGSNKNHIPISFAIYLIKCGDRNILVDAGCDTMPGFKMRKYYSPVFVLRQVGLSANEITDVIITHAHHDHIEAIKHFKNAIVHITEEEYLNGKKYIPDNTTVNVFEQEYQIMPQVKIIKCGGHSVGSAIVEIVGNDTTHILSGDECYTNANIDKKLCTGSFFNKEKSMGFIEKHSDKNYYVHTCHDISLKTERII